MQWTYDRDDPAIMLWTAARARFGFDFREGQAILELGCAETDWLERVHRADPSLEIIGVDARPQVRDATGFQVLEGNALHSTLFAPERFDWVVLLGALEHFGLGFYGDPVMEDGDIQTMRNIVDWLKPGGFVYFDVPCQPMYSITENRHYRMYSPQAVTERLIVPGLREVNRGYSLPEPDAGTWCHEPTVTRVPYHYVAVLAQKGA